MELNKIYQGDCLEVLKTMPDESINMVITSPPYWALRDYGTGQWSGGDPNCDHKMPRNVNRIRPGDKQLTASGADTWLECGKCGAKKIDKQVGLEPCYQEYIKKLCDIFDEVKRVLKKDGTCWVNLGDTYSAQRWTGNGKGQPMNKMRDGHRDINPEKITGMPDKTLVQIPARFAIEMTDRGWILRNEIIWHKPNCMPSSVRDRFTVDFEKIYFFVKSQKYYFDQQYDEAKYDGRKQERMRGSAKYNGNVVPGHAPHTFAARGHERWQMINGKRVRNKRAVWLISNKPFKDAHFATFPPELIKTPILAGCPAGGVVMDIFMGSGTTALVAREHGRNYIGIELNEKYIAMAENRLKQTKLF